MTLIDLVFLRILPPSYQLNIAHMLPKFLIRARKRPRVRQLEVYVAKLNLMFRCLFGDFCIFLAPKTKTANKSIVMKANNFNFLNKTTVTGA